MLLLVNATTLRTTANWWKLFIVMVFFFCHSFNYYNYKLGICYLDEEISYNTTELHSGIYHLASADLRKLSEVESKLKECSMEFSVPTLFLFECVLVYMPIQFSHSLLQLIADKFSTTFCINYEQVYYFNKSISMTKYEILNLLTFRWIWLIALETSCYLIWDRGAVL